MNSHPSPTTCLASPSDRTGAARAEPPAKTRQNRPKPAKHRQNGVASPLLEDFTADNQQRLKHFFALGAEQGCPEDQLLHFAHAGLILQHRQLAASAAARLCDLPDGPTDIGFGGARGGGKTYWLLAQMAADDCQRVPGLKCLLLRKVGRSNLESFEDLRRKLLQRLPHDFSASRGLLSFHNDSRIVLGHYQCEKDIDNYLGLEYDVIGIEEATQLTDRKYNAISTCCRTSKTNWRPRLYSTTNPGGIGHQWYLEKFIAPFETHSETSTRFIPARVEDNAFVNAGYTSQLANLSGWQYDAWYLGRWNFPAGQFFRNFRPEIHVLPAEPGSAGILPATLPKANLPGVRAHAEGSRSLSAAHTSEFLHAVSHLHNFREPNAVEWFAAMDYGYTHRNVVLLAARDYAGNIFVVDEHAERHWIPQRHAQAIKAMFSRHNVFSTEQHLREHLLARSQNPHYVSDQLWRQLKKRTLSRFVAGSDCFANESNGDSVATQYEQFGLRLRPATMDRVSGWSVLLQHLGDPDAGIPPTLCIHPRCKRLLECLPYLQHNPERPGDILKTDINDEGVGGDDAADALRYLLATKPNRIYQTRLVGL